VTREEHVKLIYPQAYCCLGWNDGTEWYVMSGNNESSAPLGRNGFSEEGAWADAWRAIQATRAAAQEGNDGK
jgi:hypothetical protein